MAQAAERTGVNPQTLRYNERRGLLPTPARSESGYRRYGPEAVHKVRFVKRAEELGCTLTDAEVLPHLAGGGPESCPAAVAMADEKITVLTAKINDPDRIRATRDRPQADRDCTLQHALDSDP